MDTSPSPHLSVVAELETMLREQVEISPADLKLRFRLTRLLAELNNKEGFLASAQVLHRLIKGEKNHPALVQASQLAQKLGLDPALISQNTEAGPTRRLGEDPAAKEYFLKIDGLYRELTSKAAFIQEHDRTLIRNFNRPSSLLWARRFSEQNGGAQIAIKREDMMGGGTKLLMAVVGQVVMAQQLGYKTVVTGSRNTRIGVLMSSMACRLGLSSVVYMEANQARQSSTAVLQMRCVGARIEEVARHEEARDAAVDNCVSAPGRNFLILGVDAAPAPFQELNQLLISALGRETRAQAKSIFQRVPDLLVSRGRKTADALGFFDPFLGLPETRLIAVEARDTLATERRDADNKFNPNSQLTEAQIFQAEAILEGSEYPAVTREHSVFEDSGRVEYKTGASADAQAIVKSMARIEGLICPIRTAYALGWAAREARHMKPEQLVVVNMIEPFDKDLRDVASALGHGSAG